MADEVRWWDAGYYWFCIRLWWRGLPSRLSWAIAQRLPREVALYAFVRVYANWCSEAPGPEYIGAHQAWELGAQRQVKR